MAPTKQNESNVWKYFLKKDKFIAKCKYSKKEITSSGNTTNLEVRLDRCKLSPPLKDSSRRRIINVKSRTTKLTAVTRIMGTKIWKLNLEMIAKL
jgi:hypothetical protein